jgi:hypothetical protein
MPMKDHVDGVYQQTDNGHFHDQFVQNWKAVSHQRNEVEKAIDPFFQKNLRASDRKVNW